jgi:hypothetical protein
MTSLTHTQASTLDDSVTRIVIAEQFKQDYLLVMENDYKAYTSLMQEVSDSETVVELSDTLREEWETLAEQVSELVTEQVSEIAGLLIAQLLQGQGSLPFDLIAKQLREGQE